MWTWGQFKHGQLGRPAKNDVEYEPGMANTPAAMRVKDIAAGFSHSVAVLGELRACV